MVAGAGGIAVTHTSYIISCSCSSAARPCCTHDCLWLWRYTLHVPGLRSAHIQSWLGGSVEQWSSTRGTHTPRGT